MPRILTGNVMRWVLASIVIGLALIWLLSGVIAQDGESILPSIAEVNRQATAQNRTQMVGVRGERSQAIPKSRLLSLHGRTEVKHVVQVSSETFGQVSALNVVDGAKVSAGKPLCTLEVNDRQAMVTAAQDALKLAKVRYQGATRLHESNLERESVLIASQAELSAAKHSLLVAEKALSDTTIRAPVDGFVEKIQANVGDYLTPGGLCAVLLDLDPIYVVAKVAEQFVDQAQIGVEVEGTLATGQTVKGELTFVGKQSADTTRTFRIEISLPNPDYTIRAGVTAEVRLPLKSVPSHQVSSAMLLLNKDGELGVHVVEGNTVRFYEVAVVSEDQNGLWISGLPASTTLITVGQDLVSDGDRVELQLVSG